MLRRLIDESGTFPKSTVGWTTSEQYEDICDLQTDNSALQDSLKETERALGKVTLSISLWRILGEAIHAANSESAGNRYCFYKKRRNFKDPEPANSEASGQPFSSIVSRNHVSEAKFANSLSRDVFEPPIFLFCLSAQ